MECACIVKLLLVIIAIVQLIDWVVLIWGLIDSREMDLTDIKNEAFQYPNMPMKSFLILMAVPLGWTILVGNIVIKWTISSTKAIKENFHEYLNSK